MKVRNMSIFMGDDSRRARQNGIGAEEDRKNRKSIFAGNLNQKPDMIARKKQAAQQQALKIVKDAWDGDRKVDEGIEESKGRIAEYKKARNDANEELKEFKENRLAAGLGEEPEEGTPEAEELKRIEDAIASAKAGIQAENALIRGTRLEKLKSDPMVQASANADKVMEAASREIVGMLMQEAKDHVDEEMAEKKEAAEKKAEEEKEEKEKLEKAREDKEEKKEFAESVAESAKVVVEADSSMDEVQKEIQKVMEEMKLIEEDLKGAKVDAAT